MRILPLLLWTPATAYSYRAIAFARKTRKTASLLGVSTLRMSTAATTASSLRVALCQFSASHDKAANQETAKRYLSMAKERGASLAVLPEIWNGPYATAAFPEYAEILPQMGASNAPASESSQLLVDAAKEHNMWIVGGSIAERVTDGSEEKIYNTCLVLNPQGEIVAKHRKVHLFDIDVPGGITFFESETLSPGSSVSHFSTPWGEIGVGICYDIRFAEYAQLLRHDYDCVCLVYPGAFNMTTGPAHWELLQRARALDNQCFVLTASPARSEAPPPTPADKGVGGNSKSPYPHYTAWGHSTVVSPWGDVLATTDEKEGIVVSELDLAKLAEVRSCIPIGQQRRTDLYKLQHNL